jgi:hypothetical protein
MPPPPTPCTYQIGGNVTVVGLSCDPGQCVCPVTVTGSNCSWSAQADVGWIDIQPPGSGTTSGTVTFAVNGVPAVPRSGQITLNRPGSGACSVTQRLLLQARAPEPPAWTARLDVEGGEGQVILDGADVRYQGRDQNPVQGPAAGRGLHRVEAVLVRGKGAPGVWRFTVSGGPASRLRVLAGDATLVTEDAVAFRLAGAPGERVVFTFEVP